MASFPARSSSAKQSASIRVRQASNIYHGIKIAQAVGRPLNRFVTVNLTMAGCDDRAASRIFRDLCERYGDWIRRPSRKGPHSPSIPTFVWVIEAAGGVTAAHWAVHVPGGRFNDFDKRVQEWLRKSVDADIPSGTFDIRPVYSPIGLGRYLLKGINPHFAPMFGVNPVDQGIVFSKRTGVSRSIGPAVKKALRQEGVYPEAKRRIGSPPTSILQLAG